MPLADRTRTIWSFSGSVANRRDVRRRREVLRAIPFASDVAGVALAFHAEESPNPGSAAALLRFVRDLERRGVIALLVAPPADLVTELAMCGGGARLLAVQDLAAARALLLRFDDVACRALAPEGSALSAIRVAARPEHVALVCRGLRELLAALGLDARRRDRFAAAVRDLLHDEILPACDPAAHRVALSASVRDERVTITILDDGPGDRPANAGTLPELGAHVHRFRVLGRHHALVIEQDPSRPVAPS